VRSFLSLEVKTIVDRSIDISPEYPSEFDRETCQALLERMLLIRIVERKLAKEKELGNIRGPVHLAVGQEAVSVGIAAHLKSTDRAFGAHRSHPHILSLGTPLEPFFSEILGRSGGLCGGFGGSMHLQDIENGFFGSVPIVAGTVPIAVGAALASKMDGRSDIAVAYLGDGAVEEGVVHESMNMASLMQLPILFVVENNFFASHMHIEMRQPNSTTSRFAEAQIIRNALVDGNNIFEVSDVSKGLINHIRSTGNPAFIEAVTYRHLGHVDWREDVDVGVKRSAADIEFWKKRDPISRLLDYMTLMCWIDDDYFHRLEQKIENNSSTAWDNAVKSPYPEQTMMLEAVYHDIW
jgi:TPP-dependent pyruvate/acetoin dehydrogenase alpha subunit